MNILCLSDSHLRVSVPSCRTDSNFYQTQLRKLSQIEDIVRKYDARWVIHGGDLFDSCDPPARLLHDVMAVLNRSSARWVINPGNHDIFGASLQTLPRSGLGVLWQAGLIDVATKVTDHYLGSTPAGTQVVVRMIPYTVSLDETQFVFQETQGRINILAPHAMLTTHFVPYPHKLVADVETNADVVICSHWHSQFRERHRNTQFINSGPLTRQTTTEARITPSVGLIQIQDTSVETSLIPLQADPSSSVISFDKPADQPEGIAEQFLSTLKASAFETVDRQNLLRAVGDKHKFASATVDNGVSRILQVEKEICL